MFIVNQIVLLEYSESARVPVYFAEQIQELPNSGMNRPGLALIRAVIFLNALSNDIKILPSENIY